MVLDGELVFSVASGVVDLLSHRFVHQVRPAIVQRLTAWSRAMSETPATVLAIDSYRLSR